MFFKKGSKLYSIINFKCPQCQEGDFYIKKGNFQFKNITKIHENCPQCSLKYMKEPSFFFGAMYIAYAISVGFSLLTYLITNFILKFELLETFSAIVILLILTSTYNLRLARIIWINIFVSYRKK
jgi:uncharacterized protein (DUF983 family)